MKKKPDPLPTVADNGCKMHTAGLLGQPFKKKKTKMADEIFTQTRASQVNNFYKINVNIDV